MQAKKLSKIVAFQRQNAKNSLLSTAEVACRATCLEKTEIVRIWRQKTGSVIFTTTKIITSRKKGALSTKRLEKEAYEKLNVRLFKTKLANLHRNFFLVNFELVSLTTEAQYSSWVLFHTIEK